MKDIGWAEFRKRDEKKANTIFQVLVCLSIGAVLGLIFADPIYRAICANMGVAP